MSATAAEVRTFTARKESICAACNQTIKVGDPFTWARNAADRGKTWHSVCFGTEQPEEPTPAAESLNAAPAEVATPTVPEVEAQPEAMPEPARVVRVLKPAQPMPAPITPTAATPTIDAALAPLAELLTPMIAERVRGLIVQEAARLATESVKAWLVGRLAESEVQHG